MEIIDQLLSDRLWIYTAILGSVFGAVFLAWFKDTRAGLWVFSKVDATLDYLVDRWGLTWLQEPEDVWRKRYPRITKKIDELENRISALESEKKISKKR